SAVAATPRRQTRCLLLLVEEALGGYAHVSQCEAPLPVALRLDLRLGEPLSQLHFTSPALVPIVSRCALRAGLATLVNAFLCLVRRVSPRWRAIDLASWSVIGFVNCPVGALQHLTLGRRSTPRVQTNCMKCDVVDSELRFNCVSTRPKAGQMVR